MAVACKRVVRGQVHWVQQAEAVQHPGYLLSPRLDKWKRPYPISGPTPAGGMDRSVKAGVAETGAANINTRSGLGIRDARA